MKHILYLLICVSIILVVISCNNDQDVNTDHAALPYSVAKLEHRQELLDWNKGIVEIDNTVIEKFIERRKWNMQISGTGLYYQIYHETNGIQSVDGKIAEFSYTTMLLNGTVLYTSEEYGNRSLKLGHNQEEIGINEGIMMMKVGEKARFILPPHLAYGVPGDGYLVPPYSILVYDIELLSLKDKTE
jgi:FKBP-type peptidyl-prolyl cis-trans isomerase